VTLTPTTARSCRTIASQWKLLSRIDTYKIRNVSIYKGPECLERRTGGCGEQNIFWAYYYRKRPSNFDRLQSENFHFTVRVLWILCFSCFELTARTVSNHGDKPSNTKAIAALRQLWPFLLTR